ncbi:acyltransferase [Escherichia coli]|nr:acyltransferase [Escherichia coli]
MTYILIIFVPIIVTALAISRMGIASLAPSSHLKHQTLDPLRGLAATSVMAHHSLLMYNLMNGGSWSTIGPSIQMGQSTKRIFDSLGNVPVSIFFMITAFLFFERLIQKRGSLDFSEFYFKRILRIVPMYLVMVVSVMLTYTLFGINGGAYEIIRSILSWLSFSFLPVKSLTDELIGGRAAAGVIWTLAIEWKFYIMIPAIALFTKNLKTASFFVLASIAIVISSFLFGLMPERDAVISLCFSTGMISACLYQLNNNILNNILRHWLSSLVCIAAISSSIILTKGEYTFQIWIGLSLFFICAANGNTLFGVLKLESLRFLGLISYSIYLMHGAIFAIIFGLALNGVNYQSSILLSAPTIIILCTFTYIHIERRFSTPVALKRVESKS